MGPLPMYRAVKAAASVVAGAGATILAQVELPSLDTVVNVSGVAAIALLVGRYTLRQLEDYRGDLRTARTRGDWLERKTDILEERERQLIVYATRLERLIVTAGVNTDEIPAFPALPPIPRPDPDG